MKEMSFTFTVFVEEIEGCNVAHCLEMGLVTSKEDSDELLTEKTKLIVRQLQWAIENDNQADIYHRAPADVWARFREFVSQQPQHQLPRPDWASKTINIQGWPPV